MVQIYTVDPHSHFNPHGPVMTHLIWTFSVDFSEHVLHGKATIQFDRSGTTYLDSRGLMVESISAAGRNGMDILWSLDEGDLVRGQRLTVEVPQGRRITIVYSTNPDPDIASGLQWLDGTQTESGQPFLFSQGQAINARSYVPCQDAPQVRFTFHAFTTVPDEMTVLMSGVLVLRRRSMIRMVEYRLDKPIPAYLLALAIGTLDHRVVEGGHKIWAEPSVVESAAAEFADLNKFREVCVKLFGPYEWPGLGCLIPPGSFPFGGMENPCVMFLSPTCISGDGSGVNVAAHELVHSWLGNLIGNARACDFWLNEGWTTYGELRVLEEVYGADVAELQWALMQCSFESTLQKLNGDQELQKLCPNIDDRNPDDVFSFVPYYKGMMLLKLIESIVGRERFDQFTHQYIERFAWHAITTQQFLVFLEEQLPGIGVEVRADEWVYQPGLPDNALAVTSKLAEEVIEQSNNLHPPLRFWTNTELVLYLETVSREANPTWIAHIGQEYGVCNHLDAEVRWAYLQLAIETGAYAMPEFEQISGALELFVRDIGRMKYLGPLYGALAKTECGLMYAKNYFDSYGARYHPQARTLVKGIIGKAMEKFAVR